jgi:outer membrane lipoprotein-sorting protein
MKKITWLIAFFLITNVLLAQSADKKATAILNEISAKTKAYKTLRLEFAYTMENTKEKIKENFNGILLSKGDKYKLSIAGQDVFCDGKTSWTYLKDAKEVQINDVGTDDDSFTPTKMLTSYNTNYRSRLVSDKNNRQVIELTPLKKGKSISRVLLTIDKLKKQVSSFVMYDKTGSTFTYSINKFITDPPLADKEFAFNKADHPGTEVVDMR